MDSSLFVVRNLLSGKVDQVYCLYSRELASVELAPLYNSRSPLDEWQLVEVGTINIDTMEIVPAAAKVIPWDTRRIPGTVKVVETKEFSSIFDNVDIKS